MKFLYTYLALSLLLIFAWGGVVWMQMGKPTRMSQWVWDAYQKKEQLSQKIERPKLVIVAGSNALFGVDSKILSKAYDLPVLNDGVNAGIGLPTILSMARRVIHPHDCVIVPLEYPLYSYDGKAGVQMIDFVLSRVPALFLQLSLQEQLYILWHISFDRVLKGYRDDSQVPITKGLYSAMHIDVYGDQNETEIRYQKPYLEELRREHINKAEKYAKTFDREAIGWSYLEAFVEWCRARDVKVIFMPSTLMWDSSYKSDSKEHAFYSQLPQEVRKRGWQYVGDPYDYMYESGLYFNTKYHLIDRGRVIRTEQMIKDLNESARVF